MIDSGVKSLTVMGTAHEIGYHEGRITAETPCNPLSYYGIAKNTLRQLLFAYAKDKDVKINWLRAYYITGDDKNNHSVFTKLLEADEKGQEEFPFVKGTNQFDFIDIKDLAVILNFRTSFCIFFCNTTFLVQQFLCRYNVCVFVF